MTVTVVSYGVGNIGALATMYKRMSIATRFATTPAEIEDATHIILPGVGGFDDAMNRLNASGMREALDAVAARGRVPILGICVGMQMLAESSEEGQARGLAWVPGRVRHFESTGRMDGLPLPHMGWNDVTPQPAAPLFAGLEQDARFYFLHSFHRVPGRCRRGRRGGLRRAPHPRSGAVASTAYQGHPEKSHHWGAALLRNFSQLEA